MTTYNLEDIQALIGNDSAKAQMEEIINKHNGNMDIIKNGLETGDTANNIVSFTEATTTEGINSGETHATLWGKVKKLFSSLKTIATSGKAKDVGLDDVNKKYTATNVEDAFTEVSQQMEHKADLDINGKVLSEQLPEISSSADGIIISDIAGNFTSENVEGALAECFQYANDGKTAIRNAMSGKGVTVSLEDTFTLLASKITAQLCKFSGTAIAADVLNGKTFINSSGNLTTGTMANQGAKTASLNAGGSYTIPKGYHNGSGKITANSLASQTSATATTTQILASKTAYVNGSKVTGTMTNQGTKTSTLTTQGSSYTIPAGYHSGSGKVTANISNLTASNIKKGVNVGGVVGSFKSDIIVENRTINIPFNFRSLPEYPEYPIKGDNNSRTLSIPFDKALYKVEYYVYESDDLYVWTYGCIELNDSFVPNSQCLVKTDYNTTSITSFVVSDSYHRNKSLGVLIEDNIIKLRIDCDIFVALACKVKISYIG